MKLKIFYDSDRHYVIDFTESELNTIVHDIQNNIKNEKREMSVTEDDLLKGINGILSNIHSNTRMSI